MTRESIKLTSSGKGAIKIYTSRFQKLRDVSKGVIRRIRAPDKMYFFKVQLMCVKNLKKA